MCIHRSHSLCQAPVWGGTSTCSPLHLRVTTAAVWSQSAATSLADTHCCCCAFVCLRRPHTHHAWRSERRRRLQQQQWRRRCRKLRLPRLQRPLSLLLRRQTDGPRRVMWSLLQEVAPARLLRGVRQRHVGHWAYELYCLSLGRLCTARNCRLSLSASTRHAHMCGSSHLMTVSYLCCSWRCWPDLGMRVHDYF